jgi:hypothetical protein
MPCFLGEPFQHDLFVSYSHGDFDGSGQSNLKTWSQAFGRELEMELSGKYYAAPPWCREGIEPGGRGAK